MSRNDIHGIGEGWTVKSSDGHSVGTVEETTDRYILVKDGLLNAEHRYLPAVALAHVRAEVREVDVALSEAEVKEGDWSEPPARGPRRKGAPLNAESDDAVAEMMGTREVVEPERPTRL